MARAGAEEAALAFGRACEEEPWGRSVAEPRRRRWQRRYGPSGGVGGAKNPHGGGVGLRRRRPRESRSRWRRPGGAGGTEVAWSWIRESRRTRRRRAAREGGGEAASEGGGTERTRRRCGSSGGRAREAGRRRRRTGPGLGSSHPMAARV